MRVGIHDAEKEHLKSKVFPNYALMKISAYHKARGDSVEWWQWSRQPPAADDQITLSGKTAIEEFRHDLSEYNSAFDIVYSSKVFDFTPENPYLPKTAIRGGTGYKDIPADRKLPPEIDAAFPDYSIYPECACAVNMLTRGCPNRCSWCIVPEKEGDIKPYRRWQDVTRPDTDKLVLMDNNILACDHGVSQLESLIGSGYAIDLNQGMDARLVNKEIACILSRLQWIRYIRFSCDQVQQIEAIMRAASLLESFGVKPYNLFVYVLVTADVENAAYRVDTLKNLQGIRIYAQPERNERKGIIPNAYQKEFAQRYIYGGKYKTESWADYLKSHQYLRRLRT